MVGQIALTSSSKAQVYCFLGCKFVVAAADVLDEGVSGGDDSYAAELFEPAHRSQSGFQPSVIGFDRVISVLLGDMTGGGYQLVEHPRVGSRVISDDLHRGRPVVQGAREKSPGGRQVPLLCDQHVDDLPELINSPVQIHPPSRNFGVGLIDQPTIACGVPTGSCRVDQ